MPALDQESADLVGMGFISELGGTLDAVSLDELDDLKHRYASLIVQLDRMRPMLTAADEASWAMRLARAEEGTWSIKEILGHIIDTDRDIWWPRIQRAMAEERPVFAEINEKDLARHHDWQSLPLEDILGQLMRVRWNYAMKLNGITSEDFEKSGTHPRLGEMSVLRILQLLVAHDAHYLGKVRDLIEETSGTR